MPCEMARPWHNYRLSAALPRGDPFFATPLTQVPGLGMSDTLQVTLRSSSGSREARRLRRSGFVPAILYGHGEACVGLSASRDALLLAIRHESRIVQLEGAVKTGL